MLLWQSSLSFADDHRKYVIVICKLTLANYTVFIKIIFRYFDLSMQIMQVCIENCNSTNNLSICCDWCRESDIFITNWTRKKTKKDKMHWKWKRIKCELHCATINCANIQGKHRLCCKQTNTLLFTVAFSQWPLNRSDNAFNFSPDQI